MSLEYISFRVEFPHRQSIIPLSFPGRAYLGAPRTFHLPRAADAHGRVGVALVVVMAVVRGSVAQRGHHGGTPGSALGKMGYWKRWSGGAWGGRRRDWREVGSKCVLPAGALYFVMAWAEVLRREWSGC
jgi:hypothetical protein